MSKHNLSEEEFVSMPYLLCNICNNSEIDIDPNFSNEINQRRYNYHLIYNPHTISKICKCHRKRLRDDDLQEQNKKIRVN